MPPASGAPGRVRKSADPQEPFLLKLSPDLVYVEFVDGAEVAH